MGECVFFRVPETGIAVSFAGVENRAKIMAENGVFRRPILDTRQSSRPEPFCPYPISFSFYPDIISADYNGFRGG